MMTPAAVVLAGCGVAALLALVVSFGARATLARRLARLALWLALAAVPVSVLWDVFGSNADAAMDASSRATRLGRTISNAMNSGVVAMPFAAIAGLALRRASTTGLRRKS